VFIAADGVESRIAASTGFDTLLRLDEVESILQYRLENIDVDPEAIEFHVGNEIAPKGYLWVFPKSDHEANVGLGIITNGYRGETCRELLDKFIEKRFKGGNVAFKCSGVTPKFNGHMPLVKNNLLIAGDAARLLDSLSGAGIINAILSGKYAGQAAAKYLAGEIKNTNKFEEYYPGKFLEIKGEELKLYRKLRHAYVHLDDEDFSLISLALEKQFSNGRTEGIKASALLAQIIRTSPRLLRLVRYLI
jgi:digeranylgeranylglycerophospholipid reductase